MKTKKYTVIHKSDWNSDDWRIAETFSSLKAARSFVDANATSDSCSSFKNMKIMGHYRSIAALTDFNSMLTKFNDGTKAAYFGG